MYSLQRQQVSGRGPGNLYQHHVYIEICTYCFKTYKY